VVNAEKDLQQRLYKEFIKKNSSRYDDIVNAVEAGDITTAHRLSHTLKTFAGLLEITPLQQAASEAEAKLSDGVNNLSEGQLESLNEKLSAALIEVSNLIISSDDANDSEDSVEAGDKEPMSEAEARELLESLRVLLKNGNMQCLNLVAQLKRVSGTEKLVEQIEDLEFPQALEILYENFVKE